MATIPTEKAFGIGKEPSQTCPMIDAVISKINSCLKMSDKCSEDDEPKILYDVIYDMRYELSKIESDMENIRSHVIDIRAWGEEWKNECASQYDQVQNMESQEEILNNEIDELKYMIDDLKNEINCLPED